MDLHAEAPVLNRFACVLETNHIRAWRISFPSQPLWDHESPRLTPSRVTPLYSRLLDDDEPAAAAADPESESQSQSQPDAATAAAAEPRPSFVNAATGRLAYPRAYLLSLKERAACVAPPADLPAWAVASIAAAPATYDLRAKKQRQGANQQQQQKTVDHDGAFRSWKYICFSLPPPFRTHHLLSPIPWHVTSRSLF